MRTCVLCPNKTAPEYRLCQKCYREYNTLVDEQWFKELDKLQRKQDKIDINEAFALFDSVNHEADISGKNTPLAIKKAVGRPPTQWQLVNQVLYLFDCSIENERVGISKRLSLRNISKQLDNKVKYLTVRRILLMYRKEEFMNYKKGKAK